jgi:hypothetical protein
MHNFSRNVLFIKSPFANYFLSVKKTLAMLADIIVHNVSCKVAMHKD